MPCNTCATHENVREKVTCEVYCVHSRQSEGIANSWKRNPATFFEIIKLFVPAGQCPTKFRSRPWRRIRIPLPSRLAIKTCTSLTCFEKWVVTSLSSADWDEFSHSPHDSLYKRFLIRTASALSGRSDIGPFCPNC